MSLTSLLLFFCCLPCFLCVMQRRQPQRNTYDCALLQPLHRYTASNLTPYATPQSTLFLTLPAPSKPHLNTSSPNFPRAPKPSEGAEGRSTAGGALGDPLGGVDGGGAASLSLMGTAEVTRRFGSCDMGDVVDAFCLSSAPHVSCQFCGKGLCYSCL